MRYFLAILICITASSAVGFSMQDDPYLAPPGYKPLDVKGDAIPWKVFATTKGIEKCIKGEDGLKDCRIYPEYSEEIKKLDGKEVTLMGFMFPLSQADKQTNFLIGPYPLSCPFEYHSPPSQVVEVITKTPVKFFYDPVTVKGVLEVKYNKETGVFYYLKGK
ncbi:MAG: hypothetical protein K0R98_1222 [Rickettsiaceae bacterium]|jgi:hypothetical protein|nr:hypothetical protein [Rickettsiaceae bacterium]